MIVLNGQPDGGKRIPYAISGARVFSNGAMIFGPSDFSKTIHRLEAPINLAEQNTIRVELQSEPGSFLTVEIIQNISPPVINSFSANPSNIMQSETSVLQWYMENAQTCVIEPGIGPVGPEGSISISPAGTTTYTLTATGPGGTATSSTTVNVFDPIEPPEVSLSADSTEINQGGAATLTWVSTHAGKAFIDNGIGYVPLNGSIVVTPSHTTTYTIAVVGPEGVADAAVIIKVLGNPQPQPENYFGQQYEDLIPPDATFSSYDPNRFSVVTGLVHDKNNIPIQNVRVTIHSYPEYGTVSTDEQGHIAIPVEGGGYFTVTYNKEGFLPVHRQVFVPVNDIPIAETIQMILEDTQNTTFTFDGNVDSVFSHRSTVVADEFGTRSTTMVFGGDNAAYLMDEYGKDIAKLTTVNVRATEYQTPESMSAALPPNSAFTYCAELSVDGAQRVRFEKPVVVWLDNFLGFGVGEIVPVGFYDRDRGVWVPSDNGKVVKLLDVDGNGIVDALDSDGDGLPDAMGGNQNFEELVKGVQNPEKYLPGSTY
jgi:hypothetical protein